MWHRVIQRANHKNCGRNQNSKNEFEFQRYDKELVVGLTQGDLCLCGYDYASKLLANCEIFLFVCFCLSDILTLHTLTEETL